MTLLIITVSACSESPTQLSHDHDYTCGTREHRCIDTPNGFSYVCDLQFDSYIDTLRYFNFVSAEGTSPPPILVYLNGSMRKLHYATKEFQYFFIPIMGFSPLLRYCA